MMVKLQNRAPNKAKQNGYVAITSMLVVTAVVIVVGYIVTLSAIGNAQMALGGTQADGAKALAETCVEEVLLKINMTAAVPTIVTTPLGDCAVTTDAQSGNNYTVSVTATRNNRTKKITVTISRTTTVAVTSWLEQN